MKKAFTVVLIFTLLISFSACSRMFEVLKTDAPPMQVAKSLGQVTSESFYTSGGWQDFTDFAIYTYDTIDLEENEYFQSAEEWDMEEILGYIENFEGWLETHAVGNPDAEVVVNYSFDKSQITKDWYVYLFHNENYAGQYEHYDFYLLDPAKNTLYYFHNNI